MKIVYLISALCICGLVKAQCPPNINFSNRDLSNWTAYTGNFSYDPAIQQYYPAFVSSPAGTTGTSVIYEYGTTRTGIEIINASNRDPFGMFDVVPTISGYSYNNSVILGSTTITSGGGGRRGGYVRGLSYIINVPPGLPTDPYTITYAYAMVMENGSHSTVNQPIIKVTLHSPQGNIECASAVYNLPTVFTGEVSNNFGRPDSVFIVDESIAIQQGFSLSPVPSPNTTGRPNESLIRVWTKGWREVMINLAPYRGQQVTLNFESDNCIPGGHFAYTYIAVRSECGGLKIDGPNPACANTEAIYSVPSLANGTYKWIIPSGWQIVSGAGTNTIKLKPGNTGGKISVTVDNSCTTLDAAYNVTVVPPTVAGKVNADAFVCTGNNSTLLQLSGQQGQVIKWIASTDGINWNDIGNVNNTSYNALNLTTTTQYKALVQNGQACNIETSDGATITVFEKSNGGKINPADLAICLNQDKNVSLVVEGKTGDVINWQWSNNNSTWNNFNPVVTTNSYNINNQTEAVKYYRAIVQLGVCPAAISTIAKVSLINAPFPKAVLSPLNTTICYGGTAKLVTTIQTGTGYRWLNTDALNDPNNNKVSATPYSFSAFASPLASTNYPISISNNGCPNNLTDTFFVNVNPPILPYAGTDTFIVAGQPLQLNVQTNYAGEFNYLWTPSFGLSSNSIYNPVALLDKTTEMITYKVNVTDLSSGCSENTSLKVKVFKTGPDIFVPNAFTPNNDELNDILKPIPVGISRFGYFKVYNRYGQLIYTTTSFGKGWDGKINGKNQPLGVYVWVANAIAFTGETINRKGTVMLMR